MKCLDIVITVPIRVIISSEDSILCEELHKKSIGIIEKYIVYLEEEFNRINWPLYHSATYGYENDSLVIRLTSYTDILSVQGLRMELLLPFRDDKLSVYNYGDLDIQIDVNKLEVNMDLPYMVYYLMFENESSEALRIGLERHLLETEYYSDVKIQFILNCAAVGVKLRNPFGRIPYTGSIIKSYLKNNC